MGVEGHSAEQMSAFWPLVGFVFLNAVTSFSSSCAAFETASRCALSSPFRLTQCTPRSGTSTLLLAKSTSLCRISCLEQDDLPPSSSILPQPPTGGADHGA